MRGPRLVLVLALVSALASGCIIVEDGFAGDGDGDGDGDVAELPNLAYCDPAHQWDAAWGDWELDVMALVNVQRAAGGSCGGQVFGASGALSMNGALRCAARVHAWDMVQSDYFDHISLNGDEPWDRMERAGYSWSAAGENIASGQSDPADVMNAWMNSPGHCANILSGNFAEIGVGFYGVGGARMWTQVFGTSR